MTALLSSKVIIEEESPSQNNIPEGVTGYIAVEGVTKMGTVRTPQLCTSWEDYVSKYGGFTTDGDVPLAVRGIYKQDPGAFVYVSRVVHYTDITNPATKASVQAEVSIDSVATVASAGAVTGTIAGPWTLTPGDTLDIHVDEDVGGPETVTFDAAAAVLTGGAAGGLPVTLGESFNVQVDSWAPEQTMTWSGNHATVELCAQDINEQAKGFRAVVVGGATINLVADTIGTDSSIQVVSETGAGGTDIGHAPGAAAVGTGDVGDINAVTFAEAKALIEADVTAATVTVTEHASGYLIITSDTTGALSSVQVEASSTADDEFGLDNLKHDGSAASSTPTLKAKGKYDGTYAEDLRVVISAASNGEANSFNWQTTDSTGRVLETFANLNMTTTSDDYVETRVNDENNGSGYMEAEDLLATLRPANGTYTPAGGNNGIAALDDNDFVGDSAGKTGLHAFDNVTQIDILLVPGRATSAVHNAQVNYVETTREGLCFTILDTPAGLTAAGMKTYVETTASLVGLTELAAIYWPRIKVLNPSKTVYGSSDLLTVPPAAWVAGVYSWLDKAKEGGIYEPPAGTDKVGTRIKGSIQGCLGFETDDVLDVANRDLLAPVLVNPISQEPGTVRFIDGVETLKADGNFPTIAERRGVIKIERESKNGMVWARHKNGDEATRGRAFRTEYAYLIRQMNVGAFRSTDPATAFFVDVSTALNTPTVVNARKMIIRIGLATQKPIKWVILRFSQDTRDIDEELLG